MPIPQAWINNKGRRPKEPRTMKIDISKNVAWVLSTAIVAGLLAFAITQVRACDTDIAKAEAACVQAGGDPLRCCLGLAPNSGARSICVDKAGAGGDR